MMSGLCRSRGIVPDFSFAFLRGVPDKLCARERAYTKIHNDGWRIGLQGRLGLCYNGGMFRKILCVAMALAALVPAWAAEWMTDLEAAKAKAAAENKAVLVDFTGSDWCGWCIRLRKQVLDTPAFEQYARDKFVLLEVDVPQNPAFDKTLRERNEALCKQYDVQGFPTIMVLTPQGDVVGGFGGFKPSVEAAAKPLDAALDTAALLRKAETQQGAEKLATLAEAYKSIPEDMQKRAGALLQRIAALDPQDSTGIIRKQRVRQQMQLTLAAVRRAQSPQEAMAAIDSALATAEPENKVGLLQVKFQVMLMSAQSADDVKAAAVVGRQAMELDPEMTPEARQKFEDSFADPEAVFNRMQQMRARKK